ncbi:hypothetical protein DFA_08725 [Cavenderia fasciculata]|uniref:Uncharacterized protein n=1 Tax=Cavenderia fasciculata TaxID=261658 RepID=F4Q3X1_CACFS|nr:uncharacterized protein DFA_08725 [Cavenderia fasciculata]EGG17727.1 hypothetical protein DFA_08725 [Cavenderia fasciculata]|eukprot:XP_004356211.1 hypothetical protein DFA_08725 [Cavenderia fasciculata]
MIKNLDYHKQKVQSKANHRQESSKPKKNIDDLVYTPKENVTTYTYIVSISMIVSCGLNLWDLNARFRAQKAWTFERFLHEVENDRVAKVHLPNDQLNQDKPNDFVRPNEKWNVTVVSFRGSVPSVSRGKDESSKHLFFQCKETTLPAKILKEVTAPNNITPPVWEITLQQTPITINLIAATLERIWFRRNDLCHQRDEPSTNNICDLDLIMYHVTLKLTGTSLD